MINQITIGELVDEEKDAVRQLLVESYQQYEHSYKKSEYWCEYLTSIKSSVDNPSVEKILVAKDNQRILGTLQLFGSSESAYQKPELQIFSPIIRLLAVHPEARGQGIAKKLIQAGLLYAKSIGADKLYLHSSNRMAKAIKLYEWLGFKRDLSKEFVKNDFLVKCYRFDL